MENQNPTPPVSETPNPTFPVVPNPSSSVIPSSTGNPKPDKKFSLKLIIGIIVFLLLAGGAAAGYVYREPLMQLVSKPSPTPTPIVTITPTPDPTADWQVFRNKYFELSYPQSLANLEERCNLLNIDQLTLYDKAEEVLCSGSYWPVTLTVKVSRLDDAIEYNPIPSGNCGNTLKETLLIDGITAEKYTTTLYDTRDVECSRFDTVHIKLTKNDLEYDIGYHPQKIDMSLADQILSTFKFTGL